MKPLKPDDQLEIERLGGLAGMGLPGSRIRSHAQLACRDLNAKEHSAVAALFGIEKKVGTEKKSSDTPEAGADRFRYRLTLHGDGAPQQIEVPESALPESLQARVQDELV